VLLFTDSFAQSAASGARGTQNRSALEGRLTVNCFQLTLPVCRSSAADAQVEEEDVSDAIRQRTASVRQWSN